MPKSKAYSILKMRNRFRKPRILKISDIQELIFSYIDTQKDVVICVTGDEGEGKSLTTCIIAKKIWPDFSFKNNIIYTDKEQEFYEKYEILKERSVLVIDEAIKLLYKLDFQLGKTKDLVKKYAADVRKEKLACHFLCIPVLNELHSNFRNHRVKIWIELRPRSYYKKDIVTGFVFVKERMPFTESVSDVWFTTMFNKIWTDNKTSGALDTAQQKNALMRLHPYYYGEIVIKKPSPEFEKAYITTRTMAYEKYGFVEAEKGDYKALRYKKLIYHAIYELKIKYKWKNEHIAELFGYTPGTINRIMFEIKRDMKRYEFAKAEDFEKPLPEMPEPIDEDEDYEEQVSIQETEQYALNTGEGKEK